MEILVLDIETTHFSRTVGKIVEIGIVALCLETGNKRIIFDKVCHELGITREEVESSWIVSNSTLTVEMIRQSTRFCYLREEIQMIINHFPLGVTAFNNAFDFSFLESRGIVFPKKLPCPMRLSKNVCCIPDKTGSKYKNPNVEEAHKFFFGNVGYVEQHRGADDAWHEADIVFELHKRGIFTLN